MTPRDTACAGAGQHTRHIRVCSSKVVTSRRLFWHQHLCCVCGKPHPGKHYHTPPHPALRPHTSQTHTLHLLKHTPETAALPLPPLAASSASHSDPAAPLPPQSWLLLLDPSATQHAEQPHTAPGQAACTCRPSRPAPAPVPVPACAAAAEVGADRCRRLLAHCSCCLRLLMLQYCP